MRPLPYPNRSSCRSPSLGAFVLRSGLPITPSTFHRRTCPPVEHLQLPVPVFGVPDLSTPGIPRLTSMIKFQPPSDSSLRG